MTSKIVHGSIANKVVSSDLIEERAKCNFDQKEIYDMFYPDKQHMKDLAWY